MEAQFDQFTALDIRVGTILEAVFFEKAIKPAYQLTINFGEMGILQSSAQLTRRYTESDLIGMQIIAVINFPAKRIAGFRSDCLVLGATDEQGDVVLIQPQMPVPNGWKIS